MTSKTNKTKTTSPFDSHVNASYHFKNKDIHHISWKNHGVDEYIKTALKQYKEIQGEKNERR